MSETKDWNAEIIKEFRGNQGIVGGHFEGSTLLLLHNQGAKSGETRINPMMFLKVGEEYLTIASNAGKDNHPAWYHNIVANPGVTVEVGTEKFEATARAAEEPERSTLYAKMVAVNPGFGDYEKGTSRIIPTIVISRN